MIAFQTLTDSHINNMNDIKTDLQQNYIETIDLEANHSKTTDFYDKNIQLTSLTDLPEEVIRLVLSHLPLVDKFRYERVCKLWQSVVYDMQYKLKFTKCKQNMNNFCYDQTHEVSPVDCLPQIMCNRQKCHQSPVDISVLEYVLNKIGKTLLVINLDSALINETIFELMTNYCPNVHCISLRSSTGITDECLNIIANSYGQQLEHMNLECGANRKIYFTNDGLKNFLQKCPFIQVFYVASIRSQLSYKLNGQHLNLLQNCKVLSAYLPDVPLHDLICYSQEYGSKLVQLNIDGIIYSETTVKDMILVISMLSNLKSLNLSTKIDVPLDTQIIALSKSLPFLTELRIRLHYITITTIEAISYFQNLQVLEIGLWKPFETGLACLSLEPLHYCLTLRNLNIINFVDGDSLFNQIDVYCPNLEVVMLNNVYGCTDELLYSLSKCKKLTSLRLIGSPFIAPEISDNGISEIIRVCPRINLLEIPCSFDLLSDGIVTATLIQTTKRRPLDRITFVYGKLSSEFVFESPSNLIITRKLD